MQFSIQKVLEKLYSCKYFSIKTLDAELDPDPDLYPDPQLRIMLDPDPPH